MTTPEVTDHNTDTPALESPRPFEIGITMAGAVSAGAYTAGVIDFLIEALDAWQDAKDAGEDVPPHEVKLKVLTGASAGSIVAAIMAVCLPYRFPHQRHDSPLPADDALTGNPLYDTWVQQIDIHQLLTTHDLDNDKPVSSLLDSTCLTTLADSLLDYRPPASASLLSMTIQRKYVADQLPILLTVNNLRGVPYKVSMKGDGHTRHDMTLHAHHVAFSLNSPPGNQAPFIPAATVLNYPNHHAADNWKALGKAALASSAFPLGLAPREITQPLRVFNETAFTRPGALYTWPDGQEPPGIPSLYTASEQIKLQPCWPVPMPDAVSMLCVDGGTLNNEPFELARRVLAGPNNRNPRDGQTANRAVLMIDPFPDETDFTKNDKDTGLLETLKALLAAGTNNARFKPDEIALALDETIYSRFIMTPSRCDTNKAPKTPALASGALDGFAGFLNKDFRRHDYLLGRRNCQRFLENHFSLPEANNLFDAWTCKQRTAYLNKGELPIIPLVQRLRGTEHGGQDEPLPTWPKRSFDEARLKRQIEQRLGLLVPRLLEKKSLGWRSLGWMAVHFLSAAHRILF